MASYAPVPTNAASRQGTVLVTLGIAVGLILAQIPAFLPGAADESRVNSANERALHSARVTQVESHSHVREVDPHAHGHGAHGATTYPMCSNASTPFINFSRAEKRSEVFRALSTAEELGVSAWLHTCAFLDLDPSASTMVPPEAVPGLRAEQHVAKQPTQLVNSIGEVEAHMPSKQAALAYLDGTGSKPPRLARVTILRGKLGPAKADIMEYALNLDKALQPGAKCTEASFTALATPMRRPGEVSFAKRPNLDAAERNIASDLIEVAMSTLAPLTSELWGTTYTHASPFFFSRHSYDYHFYEPVGAEERKLGCHLSGATSLLSDAATATRVNHGGCSVMFESKWLKPYGGDIHWLHALPISFKYERKGYDANQSAWRLYDLQVCGNGPYASAVALMLAYRTNASFYKCRVDWFDSSYDPTWSTLAPRESWRQHLKADPNTFSPEGPRLAVHGTSVEWLGWSFGIYLQAYTGISVWDVSFKGQRVMYEMALQDQAAMYSSHEESGFIMYQDAWYAMGKYNTWPLQRGVDCPAEAQYLPAFGHVDVICIFEDDNGDTTWRHFAGDSDTPPPRMAHNAQLVVRTISTIGNYDYIFDLRFLLDGTIKTKVFAAGYMECNYIDDALFERYGKYYGERVHKNVLANLHDHLSSWKIDLDVGGGAANSFTKTAVRGTPYEQVPSGRPGWATAANMPATKWLDRRVIQAEGNASRFIASLTTPTILAIVNNATTNHVGRPMGYKYAPMASAISVLPTSHPYLYAGFGKQSLAVTQRKENEWRLASNLDRYDMKHPVTSLDHFLDDRDNLDGTDLVLWPTVGVIHVPVSEDVPVVGNFESGFVLRPSNYHDELAAMDVQNYKTDYATCAPRKPDYTYVKGK